MYRSLTRAIILGAIACSTLSCVSSNALANGPHKDISSLKDLPNPNDKKDIVSKLGVPMEIVMHSVSRPAIEGPSYDWVYYFSYSSNNSIRRVVYSFQNGKSVGSPSIGFMGGGSYRILDPDRSEDLILASKDRQRMETSPQPSSPQNRRAPNRGR